MKKNAGNQFLEDRARLVGLKDRLLKRSKIVRSLRLAFESMGFLEVDTPTLIEAPAPEEHIDATPCGSKFLITSPELQMKRLMAAGYEKIFQICHCFRKGERGDRHLPEFAMIEWYRTGGDIFDLMSDCEALVKAAAESVGSFPIVKRAGTQINLEGPWERMDLNDAFERFAGWRPGPNPDPERFDRDLVSKVEPALPADRPVFLSHYPASMAALAKLDPDDSSKAHRFELYAGGLELANGFSELVDPAEQRSRFEQEATRRESMNKTAYPLDEHFLGALELGLDDCAGIALGLDRLVMVLTGTEIIDDVVAFPEGTF